LTILMIGRGVRLTHPFCYLFGNTTNIFPTKFGTILLRCAEFIDILPDAANSFAQDARGCNYSASDVILYDFC
jgi:hypothetical protein